MKNSVRDVALAMARFQLSSCVSDFAALCLSSLLFPGLTGLREAILFYLHPKKMVWEETLFKSIY